jgi:cytochrome c5
MSRNLGFILSVAAAAAALVVVAADPSDARAAVRPVAAQEPLPEAMVQKYCQGCHDLRVIQTSAMDAEGWTQTINAMIKDNGAEVPEKDIPGLVRYLTLHHGPVPDGPGKEILLNTCTMCHDLGRVKTGRRSADEWEETLIAMLNEGAPLSDAQFPVIHHYLSEHFNID